jgi:hypothetical protein
MSRTAEFLDNFRAAVASHEARFYVDFVDTADVSITEHLEAMKGGTR